VRDFNEARNLKSAKLTRSSKRGDKGTFYAFTGSQGFSIRNGSVCHICISAIRSAKAELFTFVETLCCAGVSRVEHDRKIKNTTCSAHRNLSPVVVTVQIYLQGSAMRMPKYLANFTTFAIILVIVVKRMMQIQDSTYTKLIYTSRLIHLLVKIRARYYRDMGR
jgi:hypothetical protein